MKKAIPTFIKISLLAFCYLFNIPSKLLAQVTTDGTVNTQVNQDGNVAEITGGETRGNNLFHSFQDFSVGIGNEAFFNNANDISNIFSRVTSGNISNIDGALRANGSANLFLINPAGIIFGENARLDIGGSFYGSSATSVLFEDGEFSAADLDNPPILTVNAPIGLGFRDNSGNITVNSTANNGEGLRVNTGNSISLLGGNVNFDGGIVTAPEGTINLGGLSATGNVGIEEDNSIRFGDDNVRSDVSLSNNATVDISGNGGGSIAVNANNLELTGESLLLSNIGEGLGEENSQAGTIEINSTVFSAENKSLVRADNLGTGRAGDINVITDTLNLNSGSAITATTFGVGDAGDISVTARDITLDFEFSGIYSNVGLTNVASESLELDVSRVVGNAGTINIDTDTLTLTNGARILTTSIAQGNGGDININATGAVLYQGAGETPVPAFGGGTVISGSFSQVQQEGVGNSGAVNINAGSLTLLDTGAVLTDNSSEGGNAGNINLNIANEILLDRRALILAQTQEGAVGNGGDIIINAESLDVRGDSLILADTKGIGDAGNIDINVNGTFTLADDPETENITAILTEVGEESTGNAGNINIQANALALEDGADIAAQTRGQGNSGNIIITTNEEISLSNNSEIRSFVGANATGNGGDISLTAGELNLTNSSKIIADTTGISPNESEISTAGNINIDVSGDINLSNFNQIQSQTRNGAVGNAGNITINAGGSLFSNDGNLILADSQDRGNGGSINIEVGEQIVLGGSSEGGFPSQIVAGLTRENAEGTGGNIDIKAGELILDDLAFITSTTVSNSFGSAGNITIDVNSLELANNSFVGVFTGNDFDAGSININTQDLSIESGGKISAATAGGGDAGNIQIAVSNDVTIDNSVESSVLFIDFGEGSQLLNNLQSEPSGIYANTTLDASGSGGNILIDTSNLEISSKGIITVDSLGQGDGGSVFIQSESLALSNNSSISSIANFGSGGNADIQVEDNLTLRENSNITAGAFGQADGGNVSIDSGFIIAFPSQALGDGNDITAQSSEGRGGSIEINTTSIFGMKVTPAIPGNRANDISASNEQQAFSLDNDIFINPLNLPGIVPVDSTSTISKACKANRESAAKNGLNITGKGGILPEPGLPLSSLNVTVNGETSTTPLTSEPIETIQGKVQPARGLKMTESGKVILTAHRTSNSGDRLPETKRNCG